MEVWESSRVPLSLMWGLSEPQRTRVVSLIVGLYGVELESVNLGLS